MDFVNPVAGGGTSTVKLSVLQVWLKTASGWQLVARHSTKLL
jgi:hypothetical protein